ncbi:MAG: hypothetical protein ACLFVJ_08705 [Persicimonas sp.]
MSARRPPSPNPDRPILYWQAALACFVIAALAGALFRFGLVAGGLPFELTFDNVRRAHSHLMFFSWVTPALMALMVVRLDRHLAIASDRAGSGRASSGQTGFGRPMYAVLAVNIVLGLASFVPFLLDGYGTTSVFGVSMPLTIILSTLSIFAWYAFAWLYWRKRRTLERTTSLALWDLAVVALVISSLGTWVRGAQMGMGVEDPFWTNGSVHFFLGLFSDGWLAVGAMGLVWDHLKPSGGGAAFEGARRWLTALIVVGLPLTFVLGMPSRIVPADLWALAGVAGLIAGAGFVGHAVLLWRSAREREAGLWKLAIGALGLKGLAQMLFIVAPLAVWAEGAGLRLMYLHLLFLGFVTLVLLESARLSLRNIRVQHLRLMQASVVVLLVAMLPTTGLWPASLIGKPSLWLTAVGSLVPVGAAIWILFASSQGINRARPAGSKTRRPPVDGRSDGAPPHPAAPRPAGPTVVDDPR